MPIFPQSSIFSGSAGKSSNSGTSTPSSTSFSSAKTPLPYNPPAKAPTMIVETETVQLRERDGEKKVVERQKRYPYYPVVGRETSGDNKGMDLEREAGMGSRPGSSWSGSGIATPRSEVYEGGAK